MGATCGCFASTRTSKPLELSTHTAENIEGRLREATRLLMYSPADPEIRFEYTTPRIRITPKDLEGTRLANAKTLHFICSPTRALAIMSEVEEGWEPTTIYEPIPVCSAIPTL